MIKHALRALLLLCAVVAHHSLFAQTFNDVALAKGIVHQYTGTYGGGVSFVDFDGDGWDDLTFSSGSGDSIYFFKNNSGTFSRIFIPSIPNQAEIKQILWVDFDNDGDKDLYMSAKNTSNQLFEQTGTLVFQDVTSAVGLSSRGAESYGAAFADINNDGWLDLYTVNYNHNTYTNYMYLSNTKGGFIDITVASGTSDSNRLSLATAFFDIDNDGFQDLFVANDRADRNSMFLNNGNNTFSDISLSSNIGVVMDAMSAGIGDYDNDLDFDLYITNTTPGNILFRNNNDKTFTDVTTASGTSFNAFCWGSNFFDYDSDGDLDLYVSNMYTASTNLLYENVGSGVFTVPTAGFLGDSARSFSNAIGDFDNDGFADIVVLNEGSNSMLWENSRNLKNWIKITLEGTVSNKDAIGSKIEVYAGKVHTITHTHCGIGYLAQNSNQQIIGLDTNSAIDSIIVYWPNGFKDVIKSITPNQHIHLVEGQQTNIRPELKYTTDSICSGDSVEVELENEYVDYLWSNGATTPSVYIKSPGDYYCTVTDIFGTTENSDTLTLDTFLNDITINTSSVSANNSSLNNGKAIVEINGGTPPISIVWDDPNTQLSDTAVGLVPGIYEVTVRDGKRCFRIGSSNVQQETGISTFGSNSDLIIFPSPSDGNLSIKLQNKNDGITSINVYDLNGNIILSELPTGNSGFQELNLSEAANGLYLITIITKLSSYTARIQIQK